MSVVLPLVFAWDGEVMRPLHSRLADREYVVGEKYRLGVIEDRSQNTHSHYFAALHEAWMNLPDEQAERFPTVEHLRKWALIKAGFYTNSDFACASSAEAVRLAAYVKAIDDYAVVVVKGSVVTRLVAKSQSYRAMTKDDFQRSKTAVLEIVSIMIGVTANDLAANTVRRQMRAEAS